MRRTNPARYPAEDTFDWVALGSRGKSERDVRRCLKGTVAGQPHRPHEAPRQHLVRRKTPRRRTTSGGRPYPDDEDRTPGGDRRTSNSSPPVQGRPLLSICAGKWPVSVHQRRSEAV